MLENSKSSPGRPRLYDSAAGKVDAFRKRLESAGFVRKEILTTPQVWADVKDLAQGNGVSAADAAAGLLELGLEVYKERAQESDARGTLRAISASIANDRSSTAMPGAALASAALAQEVLPENAASSDNPITRFFIRRKEQSNVQAK